MALVCALTVIGAPGLLCSSTGTADVSPGLLFVNWHDAVSSNEAHPTLVIRQRHRSSVAHLAPAGETRGGPRQVQHLLSQGGPNALIPNTYWNSAEAPNYSHALQGGAAGSPR
ncbi:hypothetical protein ACF2JD_12605 [Aeromonas sp. A-5]|uniref:hypothetical protein n=1 Tax=Aeromonas ichthyocola TaxID=3367746 RepID=UPI0038EB8489